MKQMYQKKRKDKKYGWRERRWQIKKRQDKTEKYYE